MLIGFCWKNIILYIMQYFDRLVNCYTIEKLQFSEAKTFVEVWC